MFSAVLGMTVIVFSSSPVFCLNEDTDNTIGVVQTGLMEVNKAVIAIGHHKGFETMAVSVEIPEPKDANSLLVIAVPAPAEKISVVSIDQVPRFEGEDLFKGLQGGYKAVFKSMRMTVLVPIGLFMVREGILNQTKLITKESEVRSQKPNEESGSETAQTSGPSDQTSDPSDPVRSSVEPLPTQLRSVFKDDLKKGHSFVITRIADLERFKTRYAGENKPLYTLNVRIGFPTSKLYVPQSVQGGNAAPLNVYILGHVSIPLASDMLKNGKVVYLTDAHAVGQSADLGDAFGSGPDKYKITHVELSPVTGKGKVPDIWTAPQTPVFLLIGQTLYERMDAIWLAILLCLSGIASACAARLAYARMGPRLWPFFVLGVWYFFSFLGLCIAVKFRRVSQKLVKDPGPSQKTISWITAIGLSVIVGALVLIGQWLLTGHSLAYVQDMVRYYGLDAISSLAAYSLLASVPVIFLANDRPARVYLACFLVIFIASICVGDWLVGALIR